MNKYRAIPVGILTLMCLMTMSCSRGPKVIQATASTASDNQPVETAFEGISSYLDMQQGTSFSDGVHRVAVREVLPAARYVYLRVEEGGEEFWIAARKQEIRVGATYFYKNGLLKTRFESKEHKRVFDRIYLVSKLVPEQHGAKEGPGLETGPAPVKTTASQKTLKATSEGVISIAELTQHPDKYARQTILIQGTCVKSNPNIMKRNWIHLQDGTADDYDLVVTSHTHVPEGQQVKMRATVAQNRDFGAGYSYELILENGEVIH